MLTPLATDLAADADALQALDDVLSVLPLGQAERLDPKSGRFQPVIFLEAGRHLRPIEATDRGTGLHSAASAFAIDADAKPVAFGIDGETLFLRLASTEPGAAGFVAALSPDDVAAFLAGAFPSAPITPALRRLLTLQLVGIGLKDGAKLDGRAEDTRKRQAQDLRAAFDGTDLPAIGRQVAAALALRLTTHVHPSRRVVGTTLATYVKRHMPDGVRAFGLTAVDGGSAVAIIDMGPLDGRPVIVLHAMALPDFRAAEIEACERLGLRLIWPLRHGLLDPGAAPLPPDAHLDHAVHGAALAAGIASKGPVPVLAFAAASKVGLALARTHPDLIASLHVAGVCLREGRPEVGARRLARGILTLAAKHPNLLDPVLSHLEGRLRRPGAISTLLDAQFSDSSADAAVISRDAGGPLGPLRFADALLDSPASARHDFLFQADLGWGRAPKDLPIHLHHGQQDAIHPLPLIQGLADRLSAATLHVYPDAGQLFWHEHLHGVLERIAE